MNCKIVKRKKTGIPEVGDVFANVDPFETFINLRIDDKQAELMIPDRKSPFGYYVLNLKKGAIQVALKCSYLLEPINKGKIFEPK